MTHTDEPDLSGMPTGDDRRLSILHSLKSRREEVVQHNHLDLVVPRWTNPEIFVRYEPIDMAVMERARKGFSKAKDKAAAMLNMNVDALVQGCVGVYATLDGDEQKYSLRPDDPTGEWTTFDADLAANLGIDSENPTAREVVKTLFITDGDIVGHARKLGEWSGFTIDTADEDFLGES